MSWRYWLIAWMTLGGLFLLLSLAIDPQTILNHSPLTLLDSIVRLLFAGLSLLILLRLAVRGVAGLLHLLLLPSGLLWIFFTVGLISLGITARNQPAIFEAQDYNAFPVIAFLYFWVTVFTAYRFYTGIPFWRLSWRARKALHLLARANPDIRWRDLRRFLEDAANRLSHWRISGDGESARAVLTLRYHEDLALLIAAEQTADRKSAFDIIRRIRAIIPVKVTSGQFPDELRLWFRIRAVTKSYYRRKAYRKGPPYGNSPWADSPNVAIDAPLEIAEISDIDALPSDPLFPSLEDAYWLVVREGGGWRIAAIHGPSMPDEIERS